jgi:hypothetical protein
MPLILDPSQQVVTFTIFFVTEKRLHGNVVYHFIRDAQAMEEWREKGYRTEDEIATILGKQGNVAGEEPAEVAVEEGEAPFDPLLVIEKVSTVWRRPQWKDSNVMFSKSLKQITQQDGKVAAHIDPIHYRDLKLKTCLKKWDIKVPDGKDLPLSADSIDSLPPEVAEELIDTFEKLTEPSEEDVKN